MEHNAIRTFRIDEALCGFHAGPCQSDAAGGAILGLIGENGAGKTTLIKTMLGVARPDGGTVRLLGQEAEQAKADIGVVLEDCFFYEGLHPRDVGRVLGGVYPTWDGALFESYLNQFGLADKKHPGTVPGHADETVPGGSAGTPPAASAAGRSHRRAGSVVRDEILDEFLAFACDEQHSILISSHITSDLEKAADYIAPISIRGSCCCVRKRTAFWKSMDVWCVRSQLSAVDASFLAGVRRGNFPAKRAGETSGALCRGLPAFDCGARRAGRYYGVYQPGGKRAGGGSMIGLVYKDFLCLRKSAASYLFVVAIYGLLTVAGVWDGTILSTVLAVLISMLPYSCFSYDNIAKWGCTACPAPAAQPDRAGAVSHRAAGAGVFLRCCVVYLGQRWRRWARWRTGVYISAAPSARWASACCSMRFCFLCCTVLAPSGRASSFSACSVRLWPLALRY